MSCNILTTIPKDCNLNIGGVRSFWINYMDNLSGVRFGLPYATYSTEINDISVITGGEFHEFVFKPGNCNYTVNQATDGVGVTEFTHSVTIKLNRREVVKNSQLFDMTNGSRDLVVIVLDANGQYWLLGWSYGLDATVSGGSGSTKSEGSSYSISLTGIQKTPELSLTEAQFLTLI